MLIKTLTVKRPNGWEYWFEKEGYKFCKGGYKEPLSEEQLVLLDESITVPVVQEVGVEEEPDLETASLAVVLLKSLSTSQEIPEPIMTALSQLTGSIKEESRVDPDLGMSATVVALKLIDRLESKGSDYRANEVRMALQYVQTINGGKI